MATTSSIGNTGLATRTDQRLSTETKHAFKTTEFMAFVAVCVGILIAAASIGGGDNTGDAFVARDAWLYVTIVTAAYLISRGLAKSGVREGYWAGGSNAHRDDDGL